MNIKILPENFDKQEFNKVANHPLQSWEWGEARKETGVEVIRLGEWLDNVETHHDASLQNVFTMTLHTIPYTPFTIGYIPRSVLPSEELLNYLSKYAREKNIIFIKFEPYKIVISHQQSVISNMNKLTTDNQQLLTKSNTPLFPNWTQMLDLTKSEKELMDNLKPKTRYNVRYAERKGVIIKEESNEKGFENFCKLYFKTTDRQKYYGHNKTYHEIVWNNLKNNIAHILIAYYKDEPLAAYELFHFKDRLYYPYGGSSNKHRNVQASSKLMWEAILLGKKLGAKTFDMWGSLAPDYDRDNDWGGFTRFKEGYGTEFVEFVGSYDLVINPLVYRFYNLAYKTRNYLLEKRII